LNHGIDITADRRIASLFFEEIPFSKSFLHISNIPLGFQEREWEFRPSFLAPTELKIGKNAGFPIMGYFDGAAERLDSSIQAR
jgi:hypothetical protein